MPPARSSAAEIHWEVVDAADLVPLQVAARRFAIAQGFRNADAWRLAIAASEAASNILKFAGRGTLTFTSQAGSPGTIRLDAVDNGPGYSNLSEAMRDHISEGRDVAREPRVQDRRGLGIGLGALMRMLDEVVIENTPQGGAHVGGVLRARK
jgi:serine/threonine-protein kinase RsbT